MGLFIGSSGETELEGGKPKDHEWLIGNFQKKVGLKQLSLVDKNIEKRRSLSDFYDDGLETAGWSLTTRPIGTVLLRYPIKVGNKLELLEKARCARVELGSWFETPLHPIPLEKHTIFGYTLGQCPNSESAAREVVNFPLHNRISLQEADRILRFFLDNARKPNN
jgi:dTDP-4-amino-4,6-dideoxygalactose transaminase